MSEYDNTNSGALFKNDKQGNENRPDYTGSINVEGTEYWISSWLKTSKAGKKYMSLSVQPKESRGQDNAGGNASPPPADDFDDGIPF